MILTKPFIDEKVIFNKDLYDKCMRAKMLYFINCKIYVEEDYLWSKLLMSVRCGIFRGNVFFNSLHELENSDDVFH